MPDTPDSTVRVVPHSRSWASRFQEERASLAATVGSTARSIEHIGSTAVPGLAAKPTIDILMVVDDPAAILRYTGPLAALGYEHRADNTLVGRDDHLFFRKVSDGERTHHLHVLRAGSAEIDDYRLVRDVLRSDPALAHRYEELKLRLAAEHAEDRMRYVTEKARWVDALIASLRQDQPRWHGDRRRTLRRTFDEDPDAYHRSRPIAPDDVFDEAVERAALAPGSTVVEIGPGTGQATRRLAERGLHVVALELGPHLAARARSDLARFPDVNVLTTSFEEWDPDDGAVDAVFACNSFHWVDPDVRFHKAADVLKPGGHLVVLSTPWVVPDGADRFWWDVQDDWAAVGAARVDPATKHPDLVLDLAPAVRDSRRFEEAVISRRPFEVTFAADAYATNLSTQSAVKELAPEARDALIERVRTRIQQRGGAVTAHLLAMLTVARRAT